MKDRRICLGDILVKRVGRECHLSFGKAIALSRLPCSDCLLVIRPNAREDSYRALFALQTLFSFDWAKSLIERGTGATYVGQEGLLELELPMGLHLIFPVEYKRFLKGQALLSSNRVDQAIADTFLLVQNL